MPRDDAGSPPQIRPCRRTWQILGLFYDCLRRGRVGLDIARLGAVQRRENPYTPGAGRKPPCLAGRDRDLEEFGSLIEILSAGGADRSRIFHGLRGVGKTVLLMELDVIASEAGWATTDVQEVGSQPDFRATFAQMASRLLREMSRKHRIRERVERALGVVKAFSVVTPGGVQLKLDVDAVAGVADSGDPEQDLVELLREIGQTAASAGSGALFLIDEMHNLRRCVAGGGVHGVSSR